MHALFKETLGEMLATRIEASLIKKKEERSIVATTQSLTPFASQFRQYHYDIVTAFYFRILNWFFFFRKMYLY
jgi:hypothetical protein